MTRSDCEKQASPRCPECGCRSMSVRISDGSFAPFVSVSLPGGVSLARCWSRKLEFDLEVSVVYQYTSYPLNGWSTKAEDGK